MGHQKWCFNTLWADPPPTNQNHHQFNTFNWVLLSSQRAQHRANLNTPTVVQSWESGRRIRVIRVPYLVITTGVQSHSHSFRLWLANVRNGRGKEETASLQAKSLAKIQMVSFSVISMTNSFPLELIKTSSSDHSAFSDCSKIVILEQSLNAEWSVGNFGTLCTHAHDSWLMLSVHIMYSPT